MSCRLFEGFSHASAYAKFRPSPPKELIDKLLDFLGKGLASADWKTAVDVGCGSGQCTKLLAPHFGAVTGFDTSQAQIDQANKDNKQANVNYQVSTAESMPLQSNSIQLVTASQSAHWFDLNKFFKEADRVLVPNGVLSIFGYKIPMVKHQSFADDSRVVQLVEAMYNSNCLQWDKSARKLVDEGYASIDLPFPDQLRINDIKAVTSATAEEVRGYLTSWSGFQSLIKGDKRDQAEEFLKDYDDRIKNIFGHQRLNEIQFEVQFDFSLLMARKPSTSMK